MALNLSGLEYPSLAMVVRILRGTGRGEILGTRFWWCVTGDSVQEHRSDILFRRVTVSTVFHDFRDILMLDLLTPCD